jgi:anhydromevalonate phosphate decarboxylase
LKAFLDHLRASSLIAKVNQRLSPELEIPSILLECQRQAFLFESVEGSDLRLAGNLYGTRELLELGLGVKKGQVAQVLQDALEHPSKSEGAVAGFRSSDWEFNVPADLTKFPILTHFEKEAGPYITAGIVVAKFPDSGKENLSVHRMLVLGKDKLVARIVPRHLGEILRNTPDGRLPVSIVVGPPPAVFASAALQTRFGLSEYQIANKMMNEKLRLVSSELTDISVPEDSEIVLEGTLSANETSREGPFVDLTGTYDEVRTQPVIMLERMHYRRESVYQAVVASSSEHSLFMGLPQELRIWNVLSRSISRVRGINLTTASNGYFHCIVSLDKSNDGDGKTAIMNCFAAAHPLKLVIAVDYDIDPFDLSEVEWALATRFQADKGMVVINGARGSSLDPSNGKLAITSKLGLDATLPTKEDKTKYKRAEYSISSRAKSVLESVGYISASHRLEYSRSADQSRVGTESSVK